MEVLPVACASEASSHTGALGRIPVRNLWLLMLYASELFREVGSSLKSIEENPDDIPDLVAEILCRRVEQRMQRNLSYGYQVRQAALSRVRGRIDVRKTECGRLMEHGKIACRFNELSIDTPRNRYVLIALNVISKLVRRTELSHRCRSLCLGLKRMGVAEQLPSRGDVSVSQFGSHDAADRPMVSAAQLAFNLALPTELAGKTQVPLADKEITWLRRLYEKGIAGFYAFALGPLGWLVRVGSTYTWQISKKSPGIDRILPSMRTDIVLDDPKTERRFVIDTKFNSLTVNGWYREETIRSAYIYQIYAYLKSQEGNGDPLSQTSTGILLHPSVGETIREAVTIQNHEIRFLTVDLASKPSEIRLQLLDMIDSPREERS